MAAAVIGACAQERDVAPARAPANDSATDALVDVNGAVHVGVAEPASPPANAVASAEEPADTAGAVPVPARAGSPAVASTPDELSALAASLVVPVAGVTPGELRGSFAAPRGGGTRQHNALDIPAPRGTPVISATAGRVLRLFSSKAGGLMIYAADPTERFILMYGHLDRYADGIRDGTRLERGQTIGYVGTTGNAPPNVPHLHFAISRTSDVTRWSGGTPVDPAPLFKR